jgi:hypothetical protein
MAIIIEVNTNGGKYQINTSPYTNGKAIKNQIFFPPKTCCEKWTEHSEHRRLIPRISEAVSYLSMIRNYSPHVTEVINQ